MGLATARALAQAGRDVVVCEQFALGHDRGSSHGRSRIVRLSYPDERWVRLAQESFPLGVSSRPSAVFAARAARDARPRRLGAEPDALTACECRSTRSTQVRSSTGSGSVPIPATAGSIRRTAASSSQTQPSRLSRPVWTCRGLPGRGPRGGRRRRERGRRATRVAVVTAGAWAPGLVGVDATPTVETTSYFSLAAPSRW